MSIAAQAAWRWAQRNPFLAALLIPAILVIAFSAVLLAEKKLDGAGAAELLALLIVCGVFAAGGPGLIERISKIGPLELSAPGSVPQLYAVTHEVPGLEFDASGKGPWVSTELTPQQHWWYEENSMLVSVLKSQGRLTGTTLAANRAIIFALGKTAMNERDYAKALDFMRLLAPLRDMTAREQLYIGTAHLWLATEPSLQPPERARLLDQSRAYLERATKADATNAIGFWTLGYVYDELGRLPSSIEVNETARSVDPAFTPWANWTIAVSHCKLAAISNADSEAELSVAMKSLEGIGVGPWWSEIYDDPELETLRTHAIHGPNFLQLSKERSSEPSEG